MEGNNSTKKDKDYFLLFILFLIALAFWASFFRYYINQDYYIYLHVECDPTISYCVTDEESYYSRVLAKASVIEEYCGEDQNDECIVELYEKGQATKLECEEDLEEWEYCVGPEDIMIEEAVEIEETAEEDPESESDQELEPSDPQDG